MKPPFLRVWTQFQSNVVSYSTNSTISDIVDLVVGDASKFEIDDVVSLETLQGRVYYVDYSANEIEVYCPGHSALSAIDTIKFAANFMFYGIPFLGTVKYLEWREYERNTKEDLIQQPSSLQVVEWSIPLDLNGIETACVDRTLSDLLQMFEALSNKEVVVEMLDEGFAQRVFNAYITNESFRVAETSGNDIATELTFIGLLEVAV